MKIITTPHPILVKRAEEVRFFDKKLQQILAEMEKTLLATTDPKGVGLAAPQVGISSRIFLAKPTDKSKTKAFINPDIINTVNASEDEIAQSRSRRKKLFEGCLSIPNFWGNVTRAKEITLTWQDENSQTHTKQFRGFIATIIQHEVDHLNGTLFTKHVMEQGEKLYKSHKNADGEDEFDEVKI